MSGAAGWEEDRQKGLTALDQLREGEPIVRCREGKREAARHRLQREGKAAYLAEHPTELNRQPNLGLRVLFRARGIPTLIVRHSRAEKSPVTPAHNSFSLLLKGRE